MEDVLCKSACFQNKWKTKNKDNQRCTSGIKANRMAKISIYVLVILLLLSILLSAIIMTCIKYNKWPIYTEVNVVPQYEAKFSAVTICPVAKGYKENILQVS